MATSKQNLSLMLLELELPSNDLVSYFYIISKLIKKYWKRVFSTGVLDSIKESDINTYVLLQILYKYKKIKLSDIKNLIKETKEHKDYLPSFEINMIETSQKYNIQEKLQIKFPKSYIKTNKNLDLWILVKWEGWYYKRNIDQDLEKILW